VAAATAASALAIALADGRAADPIPLEPVGTGSGALWEIVSGCADRPDAHYCACPALARSCCQDRATPNEAVVWAQSDDFIAIRDMMMCGCPRDFVAGLALPRTRVTGIEDPRRPDGIWPFAWRVARERIKAELEIGLAINPEGVRTQDQLHVHMLRLTPRARAWLDATPSAPVHGLVLVDLPTLDRVFTTAAERVGAAAMGDHGILVARRKSGGWVAVITDQTSPQAFTLNHCGPPRGGLDAS